MSECARGIPARDALELVTDSREKVGAAKGGEGGGQMAQSRCWQGGGGGGGVSGGALG